MNSPEQKQAVVIGGGPAGLMAAEQLASAGITVDIYELMPTPGRKFLRAGIGGLNITHSEAPAAFISRYSEQERVAPLLEQFNAQDLRQWCSALGVETYVGSSGRVFPIEMKAAPLLRRWLHRLRMQGVTLHTRHRWQGWDAANNHLFGTPQGQQCVNSQVTVFACGGASWAALGSDGAWQHAFKQRRISCAPFRPSNCGFNYSWPDFITREFAGAPLKNIALAMAAPGGQLWRRPGEALISQYGIEGSLIYAASSIIRDTIERQGACEVHWDLFPTRSEEDIQRQIANRKPKESVANLLRKLGLGGSKLALLKALTTKAEMQCPDSLAKLLKQLPQTLVCSRPLDEAISTDGGVAFEALSEQLMLHTMPGVFCAGEMLNWEAPTGGYLLTACFASGRVAGRGAAEYLRAQPLAPSN